MIPREAFLSHSSQDQEFATALMEVLRRHGVPVWYSPTNVVGGQQWQDEIGAALTRCDWVLVVLSPNSAESIWVKREVQFALLQDRLEHKIVPLLYRPCDIIRLNWVLPSFQSIDFQGSFEDGCRNLLRIWGLGYKPE